MQSALPGQQYSGLDQRCWRSATVVSVLFSPLMCVCVCVCVCGWVDAPNRVSNSSAWHGSLRTRTPPWIFWGLVKNIPPAKHCTVHCPGLLCVCVCARHVRQSPSTLLCTCYCLISASLAAEPSWAAWRCCSADPPHTTALSGLMSRFGHGFPPMPSPCAMPPLQRGLIRAIVSWLAWSLCQPF